MDYVYSRKSKKSNTKGKPRAKATQSSKSGDSGSFGPDGKMVIFRLAAKSMTAKRKFMIGTTISSSAGGAVGIASISVMNLVNSGLGTEFSNFAQEYQQYRVMSIKAHFLPSTTSATSITGPYQASVLVVPYYQINPTSASSLQQAEQKEVFSTLQETKVFLRAFPNALLWNEYNITYPADRDFGFAYGSVAGTVANSTRVYDLLTEIDCEFRRAQ